MDEQEPAQRGDDFPNAPWSEARELELKAHMEAGCSFREIALLMHLSRNAVMGKVHRMGYAAFSPKYKPRPAPPKLKLRKPHEVRKYMDKCSERRALGEMLRQAAINTAAMQSPREAGK